MDIPTIPPPRDIEVDQVSNLELIVEDGGNGKNSEHTREEYHDHDFKG